MYLFQLETAQFSSLLKELNFLKGVKKNFFKTSFIQENFFKKKRKAPNKGCRTCLETGTKVLSRTFMKAFAKGSQGVFLKYPCGYNIDTITIIIQMIINKASM